MEKRSRLTVFAVPVIIVLFALIAYEYGYQQVRADMVSIREMQMTKVKTLEKYISVIAEKPALESKLASLQEKRKATIQSSYKGKRLPLPPTPLRTRSRGSSQGEAEQYPANGLKSPKTWGISRLST